MATFAFNIARDLEPGLSTCGKFDGVHVCLAAANASGSIIIHNPHREVNLGSKSNEVGTESRLTWEGETAVLQIGKQVTAICTGCFNEDEKDVLFIGTSETLLAYKVDDNSDIFYANLRDGAHCLTFGKLGWIPGQIIVAGGNASITGINRYGEEIFWTVASDKVTSLLIFDFDGDGENELIFGTEDFVIRVQKEDSIIWEITETGPVIVLTALLEKRFAYGVDKNGTVGVYDHGRRLWKLKSKHKIIAMQCYDINSDREIELITGWSNGRIDARLISSGKVIFKINLTSSIVGLNLADYRNVGSDDLVVATAKGEIRGYAPSAANVDEQDQAELVRELHSKKKALEYELKMIKDNNYYYWTNSKVMDDITTANGGVDLSLAVGPGQLIFYAIVFAEGVFKGEVKIQYPEEPCVNIVVPLKFSKNVPVDIHIQVGVGTKSDDEMLFIMELDRHLPRFCMFELRTRPEPPPIDIQNNYVIAELSERPQRIALWLNQSLILVNEIHVPETGPDSGRLDIWLFGMRDNKYHNIVCENTGKFVIKTEDVVFAGDAINSVCSYLGIRELKSEANFPQEEERLAEKMEKFTGFKDVEAQLQGDTASGSTLAKHLVIRFEDARILENVDEMRKKITQLKTVNGDIERDYEIRRKSFNDLMESLKELNVGIQHFSRLRVGSATMSTIEHCRAAVKNNDAKNLIAGIRHG